MTKTQIEKHIAEVDTITADMILDFLPGITTEMEAMHYLQGSRGTLLTLANSAESSFPSWSEFDSWRDAATDLPKAKAALKTRYAKKGK